MRPLIHMPSYSIRLQNLMFLLSAAPLAIACPADGDDDTDASDGGSSSSPTTTTTMSTTNGTTPGTTMTDDASADSGSADDSTSADTGTTDATSEGSQTEATDDTSGDSDATTGGLSPVCEAYAALITMCYTRREGVAAGDVCVEYLGYLYATYGAACLGAYEDLLVCLSALTCQEFTDPRPGCPDETLAAETACAPG